MNPDVSSVRWAYERLLKLSYGASIIGTVPLVILPSLSLLVPMCYPCFGLSKTAMKRLISFSFVGKTHKRFVRLLLKAVAFMCAVLVPNVEFILGLNGGTSSIVVSYIMPGLLYLKATSLHQETVLSKIIDVFFEERCFTEVKRSDVTKQRKARALVILGIVLGILCTTATIKEVHHTQKVVSMVQDYVDKNKESNEAIFAEEKALQAAKTADVVETASKEIG